MTIEYIKNGDFKNDLKNWRLEPDDTDPHFAPHDKGQSILLPPNKVLAQFWPDLPIGEVTISFDIRLEEDSHNPVYYVSFGGIDPDGVIKSWPTFIALEKNWKTVSKKINVDTKLFSCFLLVSTPKPVDEKKPDFGSLRIAKLSLIAA